MHLRASLSADSPDGLVEEVASLLERGDDWSVTITHLYAVLPGPARMALMKWLDTHDDDPKLLSGTAGKLLSTLIEQSDLYPGVGDYFLERDRIAGGWQSRLILEHRKARVELLQAIIDGDVIDDWLPLSASAENLEMAYLKQLIAALQVRPNHNAPLLVEACMLLARHSADDGAEAYVDAVEAGLVGLADEWEEDIRANVDAARLARRIAKTSMPEPRWRLAHFFARALKLDPAPFIGDEGPLTSAEFYAVYLVEKQYGPSAFRQGKVLAAAIAGEYGDVLAYLCAKGLSAEAIRETVNYPWAVVGAWEYVIIHGGNATDTALIREEPQRSEQVLTQYRSEWRTDAERMRQTYRAIGDILLSPDTIAVPNVVELYRRVICDPDRRPLDYVTARVDTIDLERVVRKALRHRGLELVVVEILQTDPATWATAEGRIDVIAEYAESVRRMRAPGWTDAQYEEAWDALTDLFLRVVDWGARAGMPMMPLFNMSIIEAPLVRDSIYERLDVNTLRQPANLAWFDEAMELFDRGVWRARRRELLAPIFQ